MAFRMPNALTPSQCIDTHIDLVEWLRTQQGIDTIGRFNQLFGPGHEPLSWGRYSDPADMAKELYRSLNEADTFYVTAEMLQIAAEAAEDLEGMPLFPRDLVSRNMLILFDLDAGVTYNDYSVAHYEAHMRRFPLRAIHVQHRPNQVRLIKDGEVVRGPEGLHDGAAIFYWCEPDRMRVVYEDYSEMALQRVSEARDRLESVTDETGEEADSLLEHLERGISKWEEVNAESWSFLESYTGPLVPLDFTAWAYGTQWSTMSWERRIELDEEAQRTGVDQIITDSGQCSPHVGEHRRLLMSILLLMKEEVYRERMQPDRAARRRWKASSVNRPEDYCVTVTRLRRIHDGGDHPPSGEEHYYSHRWAVRGHWRRIHKGTPEERAVWVRPHIKGPEHAPFVPKGRVTMLDR